MMLTVKMEFLGEPVHNHTHVGSGRDRRKTKNL